MLDVDEWQQFTGPLWLCFLKNMKVSFWLFENFVCLQLYKCICSFKCLSLEHFCRVCLSFTSLNVTLHFVSAATNAVTSFGSSLLFSRSTFQNFTLG